jgi:CRISPR-associated protein Cmr6
MSIAAVPAYLGHDFTDASPAMRFGMYLKLWGINRRTNALLWTTHDIGYEVRGQNRQEREVNYENKVSALTEARRLGDNDKKIMKALADRQSDLAKNLPADGLLRLEAQSTAPFTTGLGNEHPLENGFAFLNPYGLPYLPGSGVKGVLRQATRELASGEWGETCGWSEDKHYPLMEGKDEKRRPVLDKNKQPVMLSMLDVLLGCESGNGDTEHLRGALTFWDVIPQIKGDSLMVEIMTPHQSHYYQEKRDRKTGDSITPHDSGQPTPISFLTVPPGSGFAFHVQCDLVHLKRLSPELATHGQWQKLIEAAFEHAFQWLGFGAKTAVGYGAMRHDQEAEAKAAKDRAEHKAEACRQERKDTMSSNLRDVEDLRAEIEKRLAQGRKLPVSDQFWGARIKKLALTAAESAEWTADEKTALANMLEDYAGRLMTLDAKELRKQLKLSVLRGLA